MTDDEFKAFVAQKLGESFARLEGLAEGQERTSTQLSAIVARLDEQDAASDPLQEKVDRLSVAVRDGLQASDLALNAVTALGRRVTRLEHPDAKF